jgi:antitoxin (DNA-binding transcriptional repressor) of toxin-antitoxin stability system
MQQIELSQVQLNLADLLSKALNGEEIIFTENDQPVLRLTRIAGPKRKLGAAQGQVWMAPDFNDSYEDFSDDLLQ